MRSASSPETVHAAASSGVGQRSDDSSVAAAVGVRGDPVVQPQITTQRIERTSAARMHQRYTESAPTDPATLRV